MTSRLKRKLGDLGVDTSSTKANENFCLIGTPLPPLEKSKDTGEFVPLWKQEVRDEKGRRRLHGAFTGGFSAGYFNSVGSKEGWTPQTFVSSRSDRAKQKAARPEDFMDEEDLAEIRDSQKLVDVNEEMDFWRATQIGAGEDQLEKDSIAKALEASLLPPAKDSVGARILKKMGWRLGQGIGPRVTWEKLKQQDALYSDVTSTNEKKQEDEDEEAKKHLYPPRDTKVPVFPRKDNSFGLGYTPGLGLTDIISGKPGQSSTSSGPNLSAGFGLGALNDAEEDDIDVYDRGFNASSNKLAYDEGPEDDEKVLIGTRKQLSSAINNRSYNLQKSSSTIQTFHDGRPVLQGFALSAKPVSDDRWYPLPEVPKNWTPNPKRVWEQNKENFGDLNKDGALQTTGDVKPFGTDWRNVITAEQRGTILGETPLPAEPRSVFDYLAPKDRERLKNMASGSIAPSDTAPGPQPDTEPRISAAKVEPHIAKAALHGFQPFTSDPVKQSRYTAFLRSQAFMEEDLPFGPLPNQSRIEFNKELEDYGKAAHIFKPVSGSMASRFTSAAVLDVKPQAQEGLHTPSANSKEHSSVETEKEEKKEESSKEHAARVGMYGPLTREIKIWIPAKLLCKRFGVKDPNPEPLDDTVSQNMPSTSAANWKPEEELSTATGTTLIEHNEDGSTTKQIKRPALANIGLGDDETQGQDVLTYERPTIDIFKAIFASDDEDSDNDNKDEHDENDAMTEQSNPISGDNSTTITTLPEDLSNKDPHSETIGAIKNNQEVDISTFKPTFIPRADREKRKDSTKDRSDSKKEKKKKYGKTVLVSFDVEEDGGDTKTTGKEKDASKRKKKKKEQPVADDEGMWVEKAPPEGLSELITEPAALVGVEVNDVIPKDIGPPRGRKRAIDFL